MSSCVTHLLPSGFYRYNPASNGGAVRSRNHMRNWALGLCSETGLFSSSWFSEPQILPGSLLDAGALAFT